MLLYGPKADLDGDGYEVEVEDGFEMCIRDRLYIKQISLHPCGMGELISAL